RRHTRFSRDWSSDVCSSDLELLLNKKATQIRIRNILLFGSLLIIVLLVIGVKLYISRQQEKVKLQKILTIKETERQERIRIAKEIGRASCRERVKISMMTVS